MAAPAGVEVDEIGRLIRDVPPEHVKVVAVVEDVVCLGHSAAAYPPLRLLQLRRERQCPLAGEPRGEFRQDRQVSVQLDAIQPADAEGSERPFVLEPSELPLDRATAPVELRAPLGLAWDQRVQTRRLDPCARRLTLGGRAAPRRSAALEVGSREGPDTMPTVPRFVVAP